MVGFNTLKSSLHYLNITTIWKSHNKTYGRQTGRQFHNNSLFLQPASQSWKHGPQHIVVPVHCLHLYSRHLQSLLLSLLHHCHPGFCSTCSCRCTGAHGVWLQDTARWWAATTPPSLTLLPLVCNTSYTIFPLASLHNIKHFYTMKYS